MAYNPDSTVARPLLALTANSSHHQSPRRRQKRARLLLLAAASTLVLLVGSSYLYFGPSAGLPIPDRLAPYYSRPIPPGGGNAPPPAHGDGSHPQPPPPPGRPAPFDADIDSHSSSYDAAALQAHASASIAALLAHEPATLPAARALYMLKTGRPPPKGYDAFFAFAKERKCLVDGYAGVHREFAPFWRVEREVARQRENEGGRQAGMKGAGRGWFRERVRKVVDKLASDSHGVAALTIRDGTAHKPENQATYFDGDWENTINKFAAHLPPMTVLINGRDEPRVVFNVGPLFEDPTPSSSSSTASSAFAPALALSDPTPFALSPPRTLAFFTDSSRIDVCRPPRGTGRVEDVPFLLSASSAEFTTDLVPVLSMTKLADQSTATTIDGGGGSCFADIMMPGEFYYRNSWWAGRFEYPDNVRWEDKKEMLYWRGKSNGGHIRGTNYLSFPRFRLMDLAAQPENKEKGLFDVRITQWHEWHCTDDCDPTPIRDAYNITGETVPREEAYQYKYLLDVDGNTFSGRYLGLLRSGGLVFKSTAFHEFFTPWLVPYEHFIPVRPDLSDLPAKIEWARVNDGEARRIQETGRLFAEQILTDAQNDCYWFAVLLEWGALWGDE
ncbi:CAP10 domain-containing protein [Mycena venus]|uniref:CAP10 domain-containing protein n=1 Tax=Mycena venus TaxID=2733690 RepID=A0A8H6YZJ8_9AGAR|nr:CAP10 domain-containing protein [Mycena venus]